MLFYISRGKKDLDKLYSNKHFNGEPNKKNRTRPFLKIRNTDYMDFRLDSPMKDRIEFLKPIFKLCQDIDLPMRLGTGRTQYYPKEAFNNDYQVYVWEVMPHKQKVVFKPRNCKHYCI